MTSGSALYASVHVLGVPATAVTVQLMPSAKVETPPFWSARMNAPPHEATAVLRSDAELMLPL